MFQFEQWENLCSKERKYTLSSNLKELLQNDVSMVYNTRKTSKDYKNVQITVGNVNNWRGLFIIDGGFVGKLKGLGDQSYKRFLKINVRMKPEAFLLGFMDISGKKTWNVVFMYDSISKNALCAEMENSSFIYN
uniref:Uncharacterized protein n=1 Tax=Sphaerodactylus townsendi TaxID=933632 RepID=A0ACB8G308_9SAUR